ncbi:M24 family metallopeptidase [Anatilimnocola floriformis]|uniref:M24 family metallopeptidase n=1 Tax=Anatilimnocola floriformis TaxID=2948575 RepID=UPI0020C599C6|nr:Xaa-Pro peptidase family protein [Anatilimnocola floriformis]
MNPGDTDLNACRTRQRRLLDEMQKQKLDLVVVTQIEHVQYLVGPRFGPVFSPAAALRADGHMTLCQPKKPTVEAAADEIVTYDAQLHSTLRNDQRQASSEVLIKALAGSVNPKRIGVEFSSFGLHLAPLAGERIDIEPTLYRFRRKKDPDELERLKIAIAGTGKMYEAARAMIRPGVTEIDVFNHLQGVAVASYGEMLTGTGNDYQCGARGGPPRNNRPAEDGELYILDLGPAYRGYFADNSRAIAVNGKPTDEQHTAWTYVMKVFEHVEKSVKPGKNCQELFHEVQAILNEAPLGVFNHHLGHGIGLFPHEAPHLNPNWNDTFEVGDVFTSEPGLYDAILREGMRIENDYLVTETGIINLSPFPMGL